MSEVPTVLHWFRLDLRIHDNVAFRNAVNEAENRQHLLRPVFFIDPDIKEKIGANRIRFLIQSLRDLDTNLRKLNSRLYVIKGKAVELLPELFNKWHVKYLTTQVDIDPEYILQDKIIEEVAVEKDIFINRRVQHTVYDFQSVIRKNNGSVPLTYQKFLSLVNKIQVKECIEITKQISNQCKPFDEALKIYDIPTLDDLGLDESNMWPSKYPGGETEGLKRLQHYMSKKEWVRKFEKLNTSPTTIEPSTTVLSPYLSHGCLSSKLFYHKLKEVESTSSHTNNIKTHVTLMGQLMWREFYYTVGAGTKNFGKMVGNPICTQIPWGRNENHLQAWAEGRTGYPFVDAVMRQLKQEGWIHHLARHMVACFLTRGDLWVSWEEGAKVFKYYLLDYDWSINAANWMWLSASAFHYGFYTVYNPVGFGKKTDKEGKYVRKYVPELKKYSSQYVYEPWDAPKPDQIAAACIIGVGYPVRIVDHQTVYKENIQKMVIAYKLKRETRSLKRYRL